MVKKLHYWWSNSISGIKKKRKEKDNPEDAFVGVE